MVLLTKRRARARRERESGACTRRRSASGVAAAAAAGAAKASRGEGGMHTILDSIVVKRGATGGQVQVHRRCRYACSMPRTTRRTPYGAMLLFFFFFFFFFRDACYSLSSM